jgi:hypothetical protein
LESKTRTTGIVCALTVTLGLLAGCAETQSGAPAHATTAALLREADATEAHKPLVRLTRDAAEEPLLRHALDVVRGALLEQGFAVSSDVADGVDVDLVLRTFTDAAGTHVALAARLPIEGRVMVPVVADVTADGSPANDDQLAELATRWQRRFNRSPRLAQHFER